MAVSLIDTILAFTVSPVLHRPYPGLNGAVCNCFVIKGFVVNRYCLIITRVRSCLCSVNPYKVMKAFADIFPAPTRLVTLNFDLEMHVLFPSTYLPTLGEL